MVDNFEYMKEGLAVDIAELLMKDYKMTAQEALDVLYSSDTYAKLCNSATGLYFQSALYVYSYLKKELETGVMS